MNLAGEDDRPSQRALRSWLAYVFLLGLYLSLRGYHSFDGDQAYRLPLLLHRQDPGLYSDDPFVRSFDEFNPHRGSLALLDAVSRPLGLPTGLFLVFVLTFLGTCRAVARLARAAWPDLGPSVGWVAAGLFLVAKAGNIGTNHLFEAMVLDRLVALALGWQAIADSVGEPARGRWRASFWITLATVVHPSVGLQLAIVLGTGWLGWALLGRISRVGLPTAMRGAASLGIAVVPGLALNLSQGPPLRADLPDSIFWILSVELQGPQHMLPHLWRMPQWLAWFGYLALAALPVAQSGSRQFVRQPGDRDAAEPSPESGAPRRRLAILLAVVAIGLGAAWYAIEVSHLIQATVFQPFRMSTVVRGLALVIVSGRLLTLWRSGGVLERTRAIVLAAGFLGDWLLVVATVGELAVSVVEAIAVKIGRPIFRRVAPAITYTSMMAMGLNFLAHHDTESGHVPLVIALAVGLSAGTGVGRNGVLSGRFAENGANRFRRLVAAIGVAWIVPCIALLASLIPPEHPASRLPIVRGLLDRCRFYPMPLDDIERLALWCREHTPASARFIGPPGPKTFRLWSRRNLAFNRSGSPYHGAGLADWFNRFQDHVDYRGTPEEFVRAYREHRHEFEARYDSLSDAQRAALARRQGAEYIIAEAPKKATQGTAGMSSGPLGLLHVEGRYAAYRVNASGLVHRQP